MNVSVRPAYFGILLSGAKVWSKAMSKTPSSKSFSIFVTLRPALLNLLFVQLVNVRLWTSNGATIATNYYQTGNATRTTQTDMHGSGFESNWTTTCLQRNVQMTLHWPVNTVCYTCNCISALLIVLSAVNHSRIILLIYYPMVKHELETPPRTTIILSVLKHLSNGAQNMK